MCKGQVRLHQTQEPHVLPPLCLFVGVFLAFVGFSHDGVAQIATQTALAIENVTVVNVIDGRLVPGMTVVVAGNRISSVEPASAARLDPSLQRIDGTNKYLIPGLWDMHVHMLDFGAAGTYIANGVTGVRLMWGDPAEVAEYRQTVAGGGVGPRCVAAGNLVDGPTPFWPGSAAAATPEEGRDIVDSQAAAGVDFIKVYSLLGTEVYRAILERAHEIGMPVAGHVPFAVPAAEASALGQVSMEHLMGVVEGCSTADSDVRAKRAEGVANPFFDVGLERQVVDGFDLALCEDLLDHLAANQTWQVPTLVAERSISRLGDSSFTAGPWVEHLPESTLQSWESISSRYRAQQDEEARATGRDWYELHERIVGLAVDHDVPILAGTDNMMRYVFPGFSLHDELELLVNAGLTPIQALRTATYNPAVFLEAADSLGTIEAGKLADLVLLDADPLENISNTGSIVAVVANGRFYDRARLDELLADLKRGVAGGPPSP